MSGGGSSRVSIPSSLQKTIQDIKEIARNHSDDEILAMLQECSMDPNETAQKLLYQDTFHEVKRKRDRRKENLNNREPTDSRWKPGMQGRGTRGGRGGYYSRYLSQDAGGINAGKEEGVIQVTEKASTSPSSHGTQETENKAGILAAGSVSGIANAPTKVAHVSSSQGSGSRMPGVGGFSLGEESSSAATTKDGCSLPPPVGTQSGPANTVSTAHGQPTPMSDQFPSDSGVHASDANAALVSSLDMDVSGLGRAAIKCDVRSEGTAAEAASNKVASCEVFGSEMSSKKTSPVVSSSIQGNMPTQSQVPEVSHLSGAPHPLSSTFQSGASGSKPLPNFGSRSQVIGPQKVGPSKEWKPKSLNQIPVQVGTSDAAHVKVETDTQSGPVQNSQVSEEATSVLQKKLEELHFSDSQHVIIPNHLQVPEAERCGLSFGSFDASFGIGTRSTSLNDADSDKCSTPLTESSQGPEENMEEPTLSTQIASSAAQAEQYPEHPQSSSQMPESPSSGEADTTLTNSVVPEYEQPKEASAVTQGGSQLSVVHSAPAYSAFGLIPPMLGSQLAPFESSETQARDASRVTSFIVPQPFDPSTSYYTQIYRPGADGDGRFSPFLAHGASNKYGGNTANLSSQTGQSTQENMNSLVLPNTGVATQAAGVMQTSVAVTQQPVPVFRQPAGVHISHYPPNYMPYGHYFSPFYVPTPAIHHFFSNTAIPQQPLAGSIYPPPAAAAAATTPVKYPVSQYKSGTNSGNANHTVIPTIHGSYSSSPTSYSSNPALTSGNTTINEDHTVPQYKENNVYITGQQSEASAVWLPAPGRDIPSVPAGSYYNLPQGQQMTFTTPQAGNGAFAGIYHHTQPVGAATVHPMLQPSQTMAGAVEMVGSAAGVYQQPQRAQINWAGNY